MNTSRKVIFINQPHPVLQQELEAHGFRCDMALTKTREEIEDIIGDYCGLIINSRINIDRPFIDKATQLRFIGRVGSGMDSIDHVYAESRGIRCFNSPEGNRDAVAEHAVALLLMLLNHIRRADSQVRQGLWKREENRGLELGGKTLGIIGYGNTGSAYAKRMQGFDVRILAFDKYKTGFSNENVIESGPEEIFKRADVLSLHVPLTVETLYMVNDDFIGRFAKPFWLINTSRGKVVDTPALVRGLESGKILGAGLDVIEYEDISFEQVNFDEFPEPFQYLTRADNVVMTPHIAGWTAESKYKLAKVLAKKILAEFG